MRQHGLGTRRRRRFRITTDSNHPLAVAPNMLARQFAVPERDTAWVTDITYLWTHEGWLYRAVILDLFSRAVVGWAMSAQITRHLTLQTRGTHVANLALCHSSSAMFASRAA